jgi:predicted dehydrogenase
MIGVGVIGAGHWGPNLIRNLHNRITSEVLWVADRDGKRLEQVRARFPGMQVTDDVSRVLADPRVTAVVVATPTGTHHELARAALLAGKDVLVEKPLTADSAHGEELCALAEREGRVLMVGHIFLFNGGVRRVKKYLADGELGRIYYLSMVRTNLGPIRVDVNAAWDLASHDISIASYWLDAEPEKVSAVGGAWINGGIDDAVFATLHYPGQVLVNLHVSWLNPRKHRDITVVGERRMLTLSDMDLQEPIRIYDKGVAGEGRDFVDSYAAFRTALREGDIISPRVALGEPLKSECDHFIECVTRRSAPLTGGRAGLGVVRALEALSQSARQGGTPVTVDHSPPSG